MASTISPVIPAAASSRGPFSVRRFNLSDFGGLASPVMGMDHYRMDGVTFAPHPHAGFSAISYLFEDSPGAMRNRDALGHDFTVEPGGVVWTQAGAGVMHDELPAQPGRQVHGLQIFVNLTEANKMLPPEVFRLGAAEVPVWRDGAGASVRVVVGEFGGVRSSLEPAEPFNLLDIQISGTFDLPVKPGWNAMIYAVDGAVTLRRGDEARNLAASDAVGLAGLGDPVRLAASKPSHLIVLSGPALAEPVVQYGPFIMNRPAQIEAAVARYQRGEMGRLAPLNS